LAPSIEFDKRPKKPNGALALKSQIEHATIMPCLSIREGRETKSFTRETIVLERNPALRRPFGSTPDDGFGSYLRRTQV